MKKVIVLLLFLFNVTLICARNVSNTTSIDEKTGETIVTRKFEDEDDKLVERKMWISEYPVVRYMEEYYGEGNPGDFHICKTYNYNSLTQSYEKREISYVASSMKKTGNVIQIVVNGNIRYKSTVEYKPFNEEDIVTTIEIFTEAIKPLSKTIYYNENCINACVYIEYQGDDRFPVYIKQTLRDNSDFIESYESFYSFPNYSFDDDKPYKEILIFLNHPDGLIERTISQNGDDTFFDEYLINPEKGKYSYTRTVTKCRSDGIDLYTEEYYDEKLYAGKAWKVVTWWNEIEGIDKISYYDKEGNEIPESEINFPKTQ